MITEEQLETASALKWKISSTEQLIKDINKIVNCKQPIVWNNFGFDLWSRELNMLDYDLPRHIHINPDNLESGIVIEFLKLIHNKAIKDLENWKSKYREIIKPV